MTATMANVDKILKDDYQPAIRDQLVNSWVLLAQVESNSKDVSGRKATLSLHTSRNSGVGGRGAGEALPTATAQGYTESTVFIHRNYGSMSIDGDLIAASANDKGSFGRALDRETKGLMTDLKNDVSRQIYNDSTRTIATCGTTASSVNVVLLAPTKAQLRQLSVGMVIDIGSTADYQVVAAGRTITAINKTTGVVTISGAAVSTTSGTHYISRAGTKGNELIGLRQIVADTGTLFTVDPATQFDGWRSTVDANGGTNRAPTELLFEKMIEDINTVSDEDPNLIVTTKGVRRNYAAQYQGRVRYTNNIDIKSGFKAITVAAGNVELPLVVDNDAPNNQAFFLNTSHLTQHQMGNPWSWLDRDGSALHLVQGYDKYEAFIYNYHQLTTDQRNAHGVVRDLTEA